MQGFFVFGLHPLIEISLRYPPAHGELQKLILLFPTENTIIFLRKNLQINGNVIPLYSD